MRVSVIITTYNRPETLVKVLESLGNQTRMADEVIVADDGSGAEAVESVRHFIACSSYPLQHVWQEDRGFRAAEIRNKAIKRSKGEYIVLLDGDCIPEKHFIEDHLLLAEPGYFFQGKRVLISKRLSLTFTHEDANSTPRLLGYALRLDISNSHHIVRLTCFPSYSSTRLRGMRGCNMSFYRKDICAVNGFNQDFEGWGREDSELAVRFYRYGLKRKEHPFMAICFHLWHPDHDKTRLSTNDELLRKVVESSEYTCSNGLVKKQGA